ncbi:hypothetical protein [Aquabacterium sp.]|uniref:hypothetical protein n=1 Tax=Aquabacterium sp. TaxID=1872578 RepID=UPI002BA612A3|nr:hypothetical protein [Aquabacterium sp.]HSW06937.1 hypothetical protein [Aquabacterium sp.]
MRATSQPFEAPDLQLLQDLAFVAAGQAAVTEADAIAAGLALLRPAQAGPAVARALARLNAGQADEAVIYLQRELDGADGHEQAVQQSFLGLALQLAGRTRDSQRVLQAVAAHPAAGLARAMLGQPDLNRSL